MNPPSEVLATCIPASFALAVPLVSSRAPFRWPTWAAYAALAMACGALFFDFAPSPGLVRLDAVARVMLLLVCFIAVVIVRYSRPYLDRDPGQARCARALLVTLTAVTVLVIASNLIVIALAWMVTSLALHQLLTFYRDRPRAIIAAHKKFLVSRLADACMLGALAVLASSTRRLDLDSVDALVSGGQPLSVGMQGAAVLLVVAVSLKSAQLPFHGWLIQVMEAPTPVSALLHAGVVNIGGYVMIRLAPFMAQAKAAQLLLVVIGTTTTVLAALVMMTRVSVKLALAWSTCAQMGFMLVECGLGAWHLALLHIVAHSLYKAHAFLAAGTTVDAWRVKALSGPRPPVAFGRLLGASALVFAAVVGTVWVGRVVFVSQAPSPITASLAVVVGLSLTPLVVRAVGRGAHVLFGVVVRGIGVGALYLLAHAGAARLVRFPEAPETLVAPAVLIAGFVLLFVAQMILEHRPDSGLARALRPRLFAGFYLDEIFTRLTFRIWPPRRPTTALASPALRAAEPLEVR